MRISRALAAFSLGLSLVSCRGEAGEETAEVARLVDSLDGQRWIEPRLSGSLAYAPCTLATEAGRLLPWVACVRRGAGDQARRAGARVARVVAAAVADLQAAAGREPGNARLLNALAAACFVRAHQEDDPQDLVRALDAAARARDAAPGLPEIRFNLALILERLRLSRLAAAAWREYLALDPGSAWAEEARGRLAVLEQPSVPERWQRELPALQEAASRGDAAAVRRIVAIDPQTAREQAVEKYLGDWADRVLAGEAAGAERSLRTAAAVGSALLAVNGDPTVSAAVAAVERAVAGGGSPRVLASGHRAFRDGMAAYRPLRIGEACAHFEAARRDLRRGGSPVELWARSGLARCWGYEGRHADAARAYEEVLLEAAPRGFTSLAGWTQWGLGWLAARQGRPAEALGRTQAAEGAFERAREAENLAAVQLLSGEALVLLGQPRAGWRSLYEALEALALLPDVFRRHVVLMGAAKTALGDGLPEAGLLFQEEALRAAEASRNPSRLTEALWARSRVLDALGRTREAKADLERARGTVVRVPQDGPGRKLRADLLWREGEALRRQDPAAALEPLTAALAEYRSLSAWLSVAYASLARARAELALGRDEQGLADLEAALRILEDPATEIREEDLRTSYFESLQDVYDELIRFHWDRRRNPREALSTLERARAVATRSPASRVRLDRPAGGRVVIEYAVLDDRLLTWVVTPGNLAPSARPVRSSELEALVERFIRTIRRRGAESEVQEVSARLHDLLIPPSVRALPAETTLCFVPDKALHKVPFAALYDRGTGRFLVEDHAVVIAPSLTQVAAVDEGSAARRQPARRPTALLVGNPEFDRGLFDTLDDLPAAEEELTAARAAFHAPLVLAGRAATKARLLAELDRFDALVFAGHAVINSSLPSRSYLVLSPAGEPADPGILLGAEVRARRFRRLRLVVLSACSSVGPREARVSGIAGMAQPFLQAGARTVVGTLWSVEDRGVADVLGGFYRALARGLAPAQALREAQLRILKAAGSRGLPAWSALEAVDLTAAAEGF